MLRIQSLAFPAIIAACSIWVGCGSDDDSGSDTTTGGSGGAMVGSSGSPSSGGFPSSGASSSGAAANAAGGSSALGGSASSGSGGSPAGDECGGMLGLGCADGSYCFYEPEAQCGAADQMGTCQPIPTVCTREYDPVCGCDGQTYSNPCGAASAGVSVASAGECEGQTSGGELGLGETCGTRGVSSNCAAGTYCAFGTDCGETDVGGQCTAIPELCTMDYSPVCGCDGQTYSNACDAAGAGVSVRSEGECP